MDGVKNNILIYIQFSERAVLLSFLATLIGLAVGIIAILLLFRFSSSKYIKRIKNKRLCIQVSIVMIILCALGQFYCSDVDRIERIVNLNRDLQSFVLIDSEGEVENRFAFEKGGSAVEICDEEYFILPPLGIMKVGHRYQFSYLPISRFIVCFDEIPVTAPITDEVESEKKAEEINCAGNNEAVVTEMTQSDFSCTYLLEQERDGSQYLISYHDIDPCITICDSQKTVIQQIDTELHADSAGKMLWFVDFNMDGYADLQLSYGGTMNEHYEVFLWDAAAQRFEKVIIENPDRWLSYFEIEDGNVIVWKKGGASEMYVETYVWKDSRTLTLDSEVTINTETGEEVDLSGS